MPWRGVYGPGIIYQTLGINERIREEESASNERRWRPCALKAPAETHIAIARSIESDIYYRRALIAPLAISISNQAS